ncbi:Bug family tripartite tricarboxylate transporter substrate binding protein [Humitalea sp. 24SJ18S-53]|uniref:Bug family tripartite tricarboxylate transporter substrate binding protein n=1 Tax=Humitalea sp. 24SJ18S-53 TaxID=3422307 RepID=UPI003D678B76
MSDRIPVLSRRLVALGAALLAGRRALAQPARPVRLVVGFGAGGISDLVARVVAEAASGALGQPIVIENRTGAGGNIATEFVARAAPDGTTLLFATVGALVVNPILIPTTSFDATRDFVTIGPLASTPHVLVVRPNTPATDLAGFLALARAEQGNMTWSTAGVGTSPHQTMLLTQAMTGARFTPVHYRSGAAGVQAVLSGEVAVTAEATAVVAEHVRAGTLRALAAASPERLALLPDVPTTTELGFAGLTNGSVAGLMAPRGTPAPVLAQLAAAFSAALASPALQARLAQQGTLPMPGDAAAYDALLASERTRWRPLLENLG